MKIESVEVLITSPGRNFVTLKLTTSDGVVGLGDATLNGRELSVASYLRDHVAALLLGREANNIEDTWQYLDRGPYWRRGPVIMAAISAVDMALWDIKGKFAALPLLHDAHHRLTPNQGAQLGRALEPFDLFWLEDCTPAENQEALRRVRSQTTTPLAIGEVFNSIFDYQTLITEQLIDYVRSSATHAGGITGLRKIMDFAAIYQIKSGIHGPTDVSPVGMAAALHLDIAIHIAIHNFGIQELMMHNERTLEVFQTSYTFVDGLLDPGENPGLGVELDESAAAAFEYTPAYLPVNRLLDGTMHDW
jgi:mannonate dehydratase